MIDSVDTVIVSPEESQLRLDKFLALRFSHSRTYFQSLIDQQCVLVNSAPAKKRCLLNSGDEIEVKFLLTPELELMPQPIPLDIVYEDEYLIVVNKPAGMVVHPAVGNWEGTFVNALLYHCKENPFGSDSLRPGIVHRLDKDTTGLLIAAKTVAAQQKLVSMFSCKEIFKMYRAICIGNPVKREFSDSIGRHPYDRKKMAVIQNGGKDALTLCHPLSTHGQLSLVDLQLATGRTHQIRVHLASHGTPVLGDDVYGKTTVNRKYGVHRQMLHARFLRFKHPITDQVLELEAPLPEDMTHLIKANKL